MRRCVTLAASLLLPLGAACAAAPAPDLQRGGAIAQSGGRNGVTACAGCHGARGEGNGDAGFPRLAGQPQAYLLRQMHSFANGSRDNAVMTPIAKAMQAQQMLDVSAWYASLDAQAADGKAQAGKSAVPAAVAGRGRVLAMKGQESLQVQACVNCHGPNGAGEAPDYPSLAGQHASYLTAAMAEWKRGVRKTDPSQQMPSIARSLSDQDVAALAAYYAAQRTVPASAQEGNVAAGTLARPAVAAAAGGAGPAAVNATASGSGIEQGAPLTGGNQGPGGGGGTDTDAANGQAGRQTAGQAAGQRAQPPAPRPPQRPKKQQ